jgi:phosphoribosylformimino-5-aminoimidazole carboxamide ribotide isomerase
VDLYPAIDIRAGRVVRLIQGEASRQTVYDEGPEAVAERFIEQGAQWMHLVDLDRAFGSGDNDEIVGRLIARVRGRVRVQLGGGLRSLERIRLGLDWGVSRVVVGTAAALDPPFVDRALAMAGRDRLAVGIDARDGLVMVRGWTEPSSVQAEELARRVVAQGAGTLIYTDISRDGLLKGPDIAGAAGLQELRAAVVASGGVASLADIRAVRDAGLAGVIVGRALHEGKITLRDALEAARREPSAR